MCPASANVRAKSAPAAAGPPLVLGFSKGLGPNRAEASQ